MYIEALIPLIYFWFIIASIFSHRHYTMVIIVWSSCNCRLLASSISPIMVIATVSFLYVLIILSSIFSEFINLYLGAVNVCTQIVWCRAGHINIFMGKLWDHASCDHVILLNMLNIKIIERGHALGGRGMPLHPQKEVQDKSWTTPCDAYMHLTQICERWWLFASDYEAWNRIASRSHVNTSAARRQRSGWRLRLLTVHMET